MYGTTGRAVCQGAVTEPFTLTNNTLNTTVCKDCKAVYRQLNDVYVTLEAKYTNTVCADTLTLVVNICIDIRKVNRFILGP